MCDENIGHRLGVRFANLNPTHCIHIVGSLRSRRFGAMLNVANQLRHHKHCSPFLNVSTTWFIQRPDERLKSVLSVIRGRASPIILSIVSTQPRAFIRRPAQAPPASQHDPQASSARRAEADGEVGCEAGKRACALGGRGLYIGR